jgi:adenylyltransferase/sulfurtransferase
MTTSEPTHQKGDDARITITNPLIDRYNAFTLISWWRQEVLAEAKIAVLGAGAVGNEVIKNLALMGIGQLFIADFDTIERANVMKGNAKPKLLLAQLKN